jgi:hypothetical protein
LVECQESDTEHDNVHRDDREKYLKPAHRHSLQSQIRQQAATNDHSDCRPYEQELIAGDRAMEWKQRQECADEAVRMLNAASSA